MPPPALYDSPVTLEYERVPWARVNDMAAQGWMLVAIPPIAEMKNVLGQMQMGEPLYAMEREVAAVQGDGEGIPAGERALVPPRSALLVSPRPA